MLNRLQDVFRSFQEHNVKYVIIGSIASTLYGVPRATFDLDILIEATADNAKRLLDALLNSGFGTASLTTAEDVLSHEITIFQDRVRIDVQTSAPGISFRAGWQRRQIMSYQGREFYVLSRNDLILTKGAAGREVDLEDVRLLEHIKDDEDPELQSEPDGKW